MREINETGAVQYARFTLRQRIMLFIRNVDAAIWLRRYGK